MPTCKQSALAHALLEKHALKEHVLGVGSLVSDANLSIQGPEAGFDGVHCFQTVRGKANAGSSG